MWTDWAISIFLRFFYLGTMECIIHYQMHHEYQCKSIPSSFNNGWDGIHLEPCYKRFAHIISQHEKTQSSTSDSHTVSSPRPKWQKMITARIFSWRNVVFVINTEYSTIKKEIPTTITTCADQTILDAAEANENQTLYFQIKDIDLIASKFKYHTSCYREFTRKYSLHKSQQNEKAYEKGNLEMLKKVCWRTNFETFSSYINVVFSWNLPAWSRKYKLQK